MTRGRRAGGSGSARWRELRRAIGLHRRLLAAGLAAGAVAAALTAMSPPSPPTSSVLVAAVDLPGGAPLTADDVRLAAVPTEVVPDGALREPAAATGRILAGPARRGEPLTDVRFVGPSLLAGQGGDVVASAVRIADGDAVALVRAGDLVDVLAAETSVTDGSAVVGGVQVVARAVRVIAVPQADTEWSAAVDGALLVLATDPGVAADLARAAVSARLSITIRAG